MKNLKTLATSLFLLIALSSCQQNDDSTKALEENKAASEKYLAAKEAEGYTKLPSGLLYKIVKPGMEPKIVIGDKVVAHYTLFLPNGRRVQSTSDNGKPFIFVNTTSNMIAGFVEGMTLFGIGGKGTIVMPASLGYGDRDQPGIGPAQALTFEVDIVDVIAKK